MWGAVAEIGVLEDSWVGGLAEVGLRNGVRREGSLRSPVGRRDIPFGRLACGAGGECCTGGVLLVSREDMVVLWCRNVVAGLMCCGLEI